MISGIDKSKRVTLVYYSYHDHAQPYVTLLELLSILKNTDILVYKYYCKQMVQGTQTQKIESIIIDEEFNMIFKDISHIMMKIKHSLNTVTHTTITVCCS